jgi:hypothetical protein
MPETAAESNRLDSWKEIAEYLNRNERTVRRWEKRGLPVYRVPGGQKQMVFAYEHELDAWLKQGNDTDKARQPQEDIETLAASVEIPPIQQPATSPTRGYWRTYLIIAAVIGTFISAYFGFAFFFSASSAPRMVRIGFTSTTVQAFDDAGHLIWTHTFPKMLDIDPTDDLRPLANMARFIDIKGNGGREVLVMVPLRLDPNSSDGVQMEVDCFSGKGQLLWSYVPQEKFRFGNYQLEGPWGIRDIFVSARGAKPVIWVSMKHNPWGNSFVAQLDPSTGKSSVRFVNAGTLYRLNEVRILDKTYLLAAGFNNEYSSGTLAVIDEDRPFAVSPQSKGTRHECVSCREGVPDYYFVFPRSEINLLESPWEDPVFFINVHGEEIEITKVEVSRAGPDAPAQLNTLHTIYGIHTQPTVTPFSLRFDTGYDLLHGQLERQHKLDHSLDACPERRHPKPIRVWTPSAGWEQIDLNPIRDVD